MKSIYLQIRVPEESLRFFVSDDDIFSLATWCPLANVLKDLSMLF